MYNLTGAYIDMFLHECVCVKETNVVSLFPYNITPLVYCSLDEVGEYDISRLDS